MFAKIFSQIYDSSIVENPEARFTFMDLLVLADRNGVVDMTHEAIARRTNRSLEVIRETITNLEQPDPRSRTPDFKGARLKRLDAHRDWGWLIVNYEQFRKIASGEQQREKTLERVHKHRESKGLRSVTDCNARNAMQKQKQRDKQKEEEAVSIPSEIESIRPDWEEWKQHRREKKQALTPSTAKRQLETLRGMGVIRARAAIAHSITGGYTGLYEPNQNGHGKTETAEPVEPNGWTEFAKTAGYSGQFKHAPEYLKLDFAKTRKRAAK